MAYVLPAWSRLRCPETDTGCACEKNQTPSPWYVPILETVSLFRTPLTRPGPPHRRSRPTAPARGRYQAVSIGASTSSHVSLVSPIEIHRCSGHLPPRCGLPAVPRRGRSLFLTYTGGGGPLPRPPADVRSPPISDLVSFRTVRHLDSTNRRGGSASDTRRHRSDR